MRDHRPADRPAAEHQLRPRHDLRLRGARPEHRRPGDPRRRHPGPRPVRVRPLAPGLRLRPRHPRRAARAGDRAPRNAPLRRGRGRGLADLRDADRRAQPPERPPAASRTGCSTTASPCSTATARAAPRRYVDLDAGAQAAAGATAPTPYGLAVSGNGATLVVTAAGSDGTGAFPGLYTLDANGHVLGGVVTGAIPQGVALKSNASTGAAEHAYVLNTVDSTLSVVDVSSPASPVLTERRSWSATTRRPPRSARAASPSAPRGARRAAPSRASRATRTATSTSCSGRSTRSRARRTSPASSRRSRARRSRSAACATRCRSTGKARSPTRSPA